MIPVSEIIFSVEFPTQIMVTFAMDDTSPLVDLLAANLAIKSLPNELVSTFATQIYYNFAACTPVAIAASPLSSALLATPRLFKISEVLLTRVIRYGSHFHIEKPTHFLTIS